MSTVVDFQAARAERFDRRVRELKDAGHVPDAALTIALHEFDIQRADPRDTAIACATHEERA